MNNIQKEMKRRKQIKYRISRLQQLNEAQKQIYAEIEKTSSVLSKLVAIQIR